MDDYKTNNSTMLIQSEIDVDLNELFTIDFKNLKIFLSTLLKNQNEMAQKIKDLENKIKDQGAKTYKNYSQIEKRIKIIEKKRNSLDNNNNNDNDNDNDKENNIDDKGNNKDNTNKGKNKDKYLTSNSGIEIIRSKENKNKEFESGKDKDNKDNASLDNKNKHNNENDSDNNILDENRKKQRGKTRRAKDGEKKNDTIPEEESAKSGNENESETEKGGDSNNLNDSQSEYNRSKYRKYDDPYKSIPIKNGNYQIDELINKYNLMNIELGDLKKKLESIEKKNKSFERGSRFLSLKSLDSNANEDFQFLKLQLKDLQNKNNELNKDNETIKKDLEEIKVKVKDFDIYEIFKDCKLDQGNIDTSRALIMSLEQKVFKKTGLIDEKIKRLEDGINKMEVENKNTKNIAEILKLSSEDIRRMIKNLEELENKNAEDNLTIFNDINDIKSDIKKNNNNFENKLNEINKNNNNLLEKIKQNISQLEQGLIEAQDNITKIEKMPKVGDNTVNNEHFIKLKNEFTETIKELKRKDSDLEKQIELLKLNPDLGKAKEDIIKLEKELSQKINNKEFLDLKDKFSVQNLNLNNLRDSIDRIQEIANKAKNDMGFLLKRLESLSAAQVSTRTALDELIGKEQEFIFDSSKYLELVAFNKFIAGFQKEKEKTEQNLNSIHKLLNDMAEIIKTKSSSDDMKIFEEIINNKLEELKLYSIKKFTDKIENNKNIKYLDSQIRHIIDVYIKKLDKSDSWLIAKKPLGGYSCASCEAYLGELKKSQEYTPWNKYPNREREKNFRLGNGFSRMLNMLNVDFKNQIDAIKDNAYESDNEGRNSAEPKLNPRRLSKNLSSLNINNTGNSTNKNNILPKISIGKGDDNNVNISMDLDVGGIGTTNESGGIINESEGLKINIEHNEDQPHVVKVYRKNKNISGDIQKKG